MDCKVLLWLVQIYVQVNVYSATGISSKLDFGEQPKLVADANSRSHKPVINDKIKLTYKVEENANKVAKTEETINTDVVVEIKTKVGVVQNNKTDDVDDVPVIVGKPDNFDDKALSTSPAPFTPTYNAFPPQSLYLENANRKYNFPVTQSRNNIRDEEIIPSAKEDTILRIPHFDQIYHSHYFGENPPPQLIWYPKSYGIANFDHKLGTVFKPSTGERPVTGFTCTYKTEATKGLKWYPSRGRVHTPGDPGSQINDKLAPLD
ncbi:hypothetical protein TcasGA2_TC010815 [Tribolium castaneum]|uniref:Uncharacterized protein n=1 Tax=Tribolium castaneum TaxID=7070 RepID=D6W7I7_TRICA|nr:PREDICTED: uncharacterized protein LOC103314646 [Tribolium castaneum]EFA11280.1 hypothetical protein TcasGA2_TC010815 [Tribolium castaneum]|eukprot:XP_008199364.1 PREDICTED: uncharacterized protein LOC103314646 [Tribolium castaneum]